MSIDFIACQSFAGGFDLGAVQAGARLVHKVEQVGGFGLANTLANRHLLGHDWDSQACDPGAWEVLPAHAVFGNPPCSGFSQMTSQELRGEANAINSCMWEFARYVARVRPLVAAFESVTAAYTEGLKLMRQLREYVELLTGASWTLHHVLHDARALGGPATRRRYFWVVSRVRLGVAHPVLPTAPLLADALADLAPLRETWEAQPYLSPGTAWSEPRRSPRGLVDGHHTGGGTLDTKLRELAEWIDWQPGEKQSSALRRCHERHGRLPPAWQPLEQRLVEKDFFRRFISANRWRSDRPARVVNGDGPLVGVHPDLPRPFTHREVARFMGFPDDWRILPLREQGAGLRKTWGKGITVDAGRWLAHWVTRSILGEPGPLTGTPVGEREYEVSVINPVTTSDDTVDPTTSATRGDDMKRARRAFFRRSEAPAPQPDPTHVPEAERAPVTGTVLTEEVEPSEPEVPEPTEATPPPAVFVEPAAQEQPAEEHPAEAVPDVGPGAWSGSWTGPVTDAELELARETATAEADPKPAPEPVTESTSEDTELPAAEPSEAPASVASSRGRGRPRPADVLERDTRVFNALADGAEKTKYELAEELGLEVQRAYQSLWRMHLQGLVKRERHGRDHRWHQISEVGPQA